MRHVVGFWMIVIFGGMAFFSIAPQAPRHWAYVGWSGVAIGMLLICSTVQRA